MNTAQESEVSGFVREMIESRHKQTGSERLSIYFVYDVISTATKAANSMGLELQFLKQYSEMTEKYSDDGGYVQLIRDLFCKVVRMRDAMSDTKTQMIRKAQKFIELNYMREELSLGQVASAIGITPNYLSALFSRESGETFSEYLNRIRIREATRMLRTTDDSINVIAGMTGYSDPVYFSKVFKRLMGMSPRAYRGVK